MAKEYNIILIDVVTQGKVNTGDHTWDEYLNTFQFKAYHGKRGLEDRGEVVCKYCGTINTVNIDEWNRYISIVEQIHLDDPDHQYNATLGKLGGKS